MIFYSFTIVSIHIFLSISGDIKKGPFTIILSIVLALSFYICPKLYKRIKSIEIIIYNKNIDLKRKIFWVITFFMISFAILFVWYLAYAPGAFSPDSINQIGQVMSGEYSDHHPVLQTLFAFGLPIKITGKVEAIVIFQIIEFSGVLTYLAYTFFEYVNSKFAIFSLLYILLNPMGARILLHPWKDVSFAATATLLMIFGLRIYLTNGKWINHKGRILVITLALIGTTFFRHNGILFTLPFLVAVLMCIGIRKWAKIIILFIIMSIFIKGPLYNVLRVEKMNGEKIETIGALMTMLGNIAKEAPDSFDEETAEFVFSIASREAWEENYTCGSFSTMRFSETGIRRDVIEQTSIFQIISMTLKSLWRAPVPALKGLFSLTDVIYAIDGDIDWESNNDIYIVDNNFGVTKKHNEWLKDILGNYRYILQKSIFKYIFWYIGIVDLIVIFSLLGTCNLCKSVDLKKILFCLPLLIYNFGTVLLISGNNVRLFYLSFPICPIIILLLFGEKMEAQNRKDI